MKYFYQENDGEIEIILETEEGFEWICDCGLTSYQKSWEHADMICKALNGDK